MNTERWGKVRSLFDAALDLPPAKRGRFLDNACVGEVKLRREVQSLLASHSDANSFMEHPAVGAVADVIEGNFKNSAVR